MAISQRPALCTAARAASHGASIVATYPVVHGERTAKKIVDGLVLASCVIAIVGHLAGVVPWRVVVMIAAPLVQLAYYKLRTKVEANDCIRLTWIGTAMLAAYNGWITLGLPGV